MPVDTDEETNGEGEQSDETLFLDEEDELYGYGVLNVHENCLVNIPGVDGTLSTPDNIVTERTDDLIQRVAEFHGLESVSHLRVVQVRLDNELDKQSQEVLETESQ